MRNSTDIMIEYPALKTTPSNHLPVDGCDMNYKKESPKKNKKSSEQNYYILLNEEKLKAKEAEKKK